MSPNLWFNTIDKTPWQKLVFVWGECFYVRKRDPKNFFSWRFLSDRSVVLRISTEGRAIDRSDVRVIVPMEKVGRVCAATAQVG